MLWMEPWLTVLLRHFLSNGRTNMKRHTIDRRREKNNVGFKRTKPNKCYANGLLDQTCFFLWMELPNMYGSYKHGRENEGHVRTPDFNLTSAQGLVVEQTGLLWCVDGRKVGRSRSKIYQHIWHMFGFAWPKKWTWFPRDSLVDFPIGTIRQLLEQIQGMGSSLHGDWMMCIPCILSGSYLSSMVVIHLWL